MITITTIKSLAERLIEDDVPKLYRIERDDDDSLAISEYIVKEVTFEKLCAKLTVMDEQYWMYIVDPFQWNNWYATEEEAKNAINDENNKTKL